MICPDCREELLPNASRCKCGWKLPAAVVSTKTTGGHDPDWWRCADEMLGQRCALPGSISSGTRGDGPWYCADHYFRHRAAGKQAPPGGFRPIRDLVKRAVPDPEADAERAAIQAES